MIKAIINIIILFSFIHILSCSGSKKCNELNVLTYHGFMIEEAGCGDIVRCAIALIVDKDKYYGNLLKNNVKGVRYSLFEMRSHPYYDEIFLSGYSAKRGCAYTASVIVHELYHIIFQKIRNGASILSEKAFLAAENTTLDQIRKMGRDEEEKLALRRQLSFLEKYGTPDDVNYQKLKMR